MPSKTNALNASELILPCDFKNLVGVTTSLIVKPRYLQPDSSDNLENNDVR